MKGAKQLIRPIVQRLSPYVPGEQLQIKGLIKLNTNENPYPPSPKVLRAVRNAVDDRLRLYPDPSASSLREKLAKNPRGVSGNIIVGSVWDEFLVLAVRSFVDPSADCKRGSQCLVQYFTP